MPRKTKRKHANSSGCRPNDRKTKTEQNKSTRQRGQSWRRLEQEAAELPWCRPFTETLEDNTDLEDDTSILKTVLTYLLLIEYT
ncbi:hypothetical protein GQ600_26563 [Phytophthora cactorum]|nr:hypothetical protein GQ600_26563 [Phytophthora cactorum]